MSRPIDADALIAQMKADAEQMEEPIAKMFTYAAINDVKHAPTIEPEPKWVLCSERLPEDTVIVTAETKTFKHKYVCEAVWIPRWSKIAEYDNWEDCSEYNEDEDEYYVLEGWYERVHNWDEYSFVGIEDDVIAWMPLPKPYGGDPG